METGTNGRIGTAVVRDLPVGSSGVLATPTVDAPQRMRLAELGLRAGQQVRMVQHSIGGARIIAVRGSRIALDARTAGRLPLMGEVGE